MGIYMLQRKEKDDQFRWKFIETKYETIKLLNVNCCGSTDSDEDFITKDNAHDKKKREL